LKADAPVAQNLNIQFLNLNIEISLEFDAWCLGFIEF
jgi:hypothetical protein